MEHYISLKEIATLRYWYILTKRVENILSSQLDYQYALMAYFLLGKNIPLSKAIMGEVLTEHFLTIFVHTFWEIGGVLFWRGDIFSSQLGLF